MFPCEYCLSFKNNFFEKHLSTTASNYENLASNYEKCFSRKFAKRTRTNQLQLNSCNSNSCNSKDYLNRTSFSVLSEFTSKPLQENSFNSNSHNSKNHLNRTNFSVLWTYFSSCNPNFGFGV